MGKFKPDGESASRRDNRCVTFSQMDPMADCLRH